LCLPNVFLRYPTVRYPKITFPSTTGNKLIKSRAGCIFSWENCSSHLHRDFGISGRGTRMRSKWFVWQRANTLSGTLLPGGLRRIRPLEYGICANDRGIAGQDLSRQLTPVWPSLTFNLTKWPWGLCKCQASWPLIECWFNVPLHLWSYWAFSGFSRGSDTIITPA